MTLGAVMGGHGAPEREPAGKPAAQPGQADSGASQGRRRTIAASLIGILGVTLVSVVFIVSFVGALHAPGPRSVPVGVVGGQAQASTLRSVLAHQAPDGYTVTAYPSAAAARQAIDNRSADAALIPGTRAPLLLVATAVGNAVTNATIQDFETAAASSGVRLPVRDVRPLHSSDPQGLCQVFFVVALLAPSLVFGNALVTRVAQALNPVLQLGVIAVYSAVVSAVAITFADAVIGALTGAPWGLFGIGTLLAFAAAVSAAAVARWAGGIGYLLLFLLLIPIGVASSGTTLGPNMITPWYADLGKALPAGAALPAVQNTVYFSGNAITAPLLILSAWAVAGSIALALVTVLHPPLRGQQAPSGTEADRQWHRASEPSPH